MYIYIYIYVCMYNYRLYTYIRDYQRFRTIWDVPKPKYGGAQNLCDIQDSEQFWMYLNLNMAAPQTFARTFTKPGSHLY